MLNEEEFNLAKTIHAGKFELLCPTIQLLDCPQYTHCWLKGSGVIRTDDDGRLYFRMVAPSGNTIASRPRRERIPGGHYEPTDNVMLCAVDEFGREWRSNWFVPDEPALPTPQWIVSGRLMHLGYAEQSPKNTESHARIYIPCTDFLPFDLATETKVLEENQLRFRSVARNRHMRQIGQAEVEFRDESHQWLIINATQQSPIGHVWVGNMCQAISYILSRTMTPAVAMRRFNNQYRLELFSGPFLRFHSLLTRPIADEL